MEREVIASVSMEYNSRALYEYQLKGGRTYMEIQSIFLKQDIEGLALQRSNQLVRHRGVTRPEVQASAENF